MGVIRGEGDVKDPGSMSTQCAGQVGMLPVNHTLLEQTKASFFFLSGSVFGNILNNLSLPCSLLYILFHYEYLFYFLLVLKFPLG